LRRLLATAVAFALSTFGATTAARAATLRGTPGADRLLGTAAHDMITGLSGNDLLAGRGGRDTLSAGPGDDRIAVQGDASRDTVLCGAGHDIVTAELGDQIAADCEVLSRQLSRDRLLDEPAQHETQVEPSSAAFGSTIVTIFQSGRHLGGGAAGIGWATSRNAGTTWRSGFLPHDADVDTLSDPVVAYDARHRVWLAATLSEAEGSGGDIGLGIFINRSTDGIKWGRPIDAATDRSERYDKEWITCDNWASSPFRGRCYVTYLDFARSSISTRRSNDGGLTWSAPVAVQPMERSSIMNGPQPVVRPDGSVIVPFSVFAALDGNDHIGVFRSTDGGVTFSAPTRIARLVNEDVAGMRAPPFTSAAVDAGGTVYVAWSDARYRAEAAADDIVLATSRDGVSWSQPELVPIEPPGSTVDLFIPALAVDPATSGRTAQVAITFHSLPQEGGCGYLLPTCTGGVDVGIVTSSDGGRTWKRPQRLTAEPMRLLSMADGDIGRMLGDYIATSYVRGRPMPVFSLASPPIGGQLRQAIFATTRLS
jgi:Ca2+-binding RTX toxin-like protein